MCFDSSNLIRRWGLKNIVFEQLVQPMAHMIADMSV